MCMLQIQRKTMKIDKKHSTKFSNTHEALNKCATFIMDPGLQEEGWVWFVTVPLLSSLLFVGVQSLGRVRLFATPWTAACQASLSFTISQSLLKLMSIKSATPSNHLILCHLILLLPWIFPSIRVFSNELALYIRWSKDWSFSFSISPSNEYSGLITFRMDWFDLLAVQGTLKSLLQHHCSKASILQHSAFSMVQLSHPYMTAGKIIALILLLTWYNLLIKIIIKVYEKVYLNHKGKKCRISDKVLSPAFKTFQGCYLLPLALVPPGGAAELGRPSSPSFRDKRERRAGTWSDLIPTFGDRGIVFHKPV